MKWFENRSLQRLALYLLAGMFLILIAEYVTIRYKIEVLEEVEEKKDFARSAQLSGQQIALLVQQHISGQENSIAEIGSRMDEQDHFLEILEAGGRIDGTQVFLKPLSRLPRISFDELEKTWTKYKTNVNTLLFEQPASSPVVDSLGNVISQAPQVNARAVIASQWLTLSNWYKKLEIDLTEEANQKKESVETWVLAFILFDLVLLLALCYIFYRNVLNPLSVLEDDVRSQHQNFKLAKNEIGSLTHEVNEILEQLKDAADFVSSIGEGKLDIDYKTLDQNYAPGKNKLADSLINMQQKLKAMHVEEQRRKWANEGLTKFVDILRSSNDNLQVLGDKIISALVQYTGSNQGGLYALNDDDENNKYLELVSMFAFNSKKFQVQKVRLGEGILGQTFLEKETTVLTEIPDEYIRITSGLGEANPRSILFVPLKVDQSVYGMVELATFDTYDEHEVQFVERLGETIASTLASVKASQKNRTLIEQFQQQTEEMRAQEEEMRQNMEELQATQEEMARKERDYIAKINALEESAQQSSGTPAEIQELHSTLSRKEMEFRGQIRDLELKLAQQPAKAEDWQVAEDVQKALKFQMEALRITEEELARK
jgi:putative methionine-R-sulfoxide reductase with GAF domain/HAMP domain-containing protein